MTDQPKNPRGFTIEHAENGAVVVSCLETGKLLGGYESRFDALSAIAEDWGFYLQSPESGGNTSMGCGFYPPIKPTHIYLSDDDVKRQFGDLEVGQGSVRS